LRELACIRPTSVDKFAGVKGVGAQKLKDFGESFVAAIDEYCQANDLATDQDSPHPSTGASVPRQSRPIKSTSFVAFDLFRAGKSIDEVATVLGRAQSTVSGYLSDFIRHDNIIDPKPWVDDATIRRIDSALHVAEEGRLKPIFEHLGGDVSYDAIRIVLTCRQNSDPPDENEDDASDE
jgi:ATP-dependent DNA helicase RecQ